MLLNALKLLVRLRWQVSASGLLNLFQLFPKVLFRQPVPTRRTVNLEKKATSTEIGSTSADKSMHFLVLHLSLILCRCCVSCVHVSGLC